MNNYLTYQTIKNDNPLLDFIIASGFVINKRKSSAKWIKLEKNKERIVYNSKEIRYFNPHNSDDKGDVINFVANRLDGLVKPTKDSQDIFKAVNILKKFDITTAKNAVQKQRKIISKIDISSQNADKEFNYYPLEDYSYLTINRAISKSTIDSKIFKNRIFNSQYINQNNGHIFNNIGFGLFKGNKVVGLEVKHPDGGLILGDSNCVFHTNYSDLKSVDFVFIAESTIDALSHYEIFSKHERMKNKEVVYLSTSGNIYDNKVTEIFEVFNHLPANNNTCFFSITDNDSKGLEYDHFLCAEFLKRDGYKDLTFDFNSHFYIYKFSNLDKDLLKAIKSVVSANNDRLSKGLSEPSFGDYVVLKNSADITELHMPIQFTLDNKFASELFATLFNNTNPLKSHKPDQFDDWNSYLMKKKRNGKAFQDKSKIANVKPKKIGK